MVVNVLHRRVGLEIAAEPVTMDQQTATLPKQGLAFIDEAERTVEINGAGQDG
jgi:hypothetical protein